MTLYSFDFDDTLFHTMLPDPGMQIWEDKMKIMYPDEPEKWKWPHRGWWSKPETIDMNIFETPMNNWTYREYLKACEDIDSLKILATGRLQKVPEMRENIEKILNKHNFSFDEIWIIQSSDTQQNGNGENGIYLNWGGDTFDFKTKLFSKLIEETNCDKFVMYDDRQEHLPRFEEWALSQDCEITIVDVVNKVSITINEKI